MKKERKENYIIFICLLLLISLSTMLIKDKQNEKNDELLANIETTSETITTTTETTTKKIVWDNLTEEELIRHGVNIVIYANQLLRAAFPAMQNAAELILKNHRAKECDDICMPFKDIIRLIPDGE